MALVFKSGEILLWIIGNMAKSQHHKIEKKKKKPRFSYKHKFIRKTRGYRFALDTRETVDSTGCCKAD
jgi:hypothetical protein